MCQGFKHFSAFLHHFVLAKLATSSIGVKSNDNVEMLNRMDCDVSRAMVKKKNHCKESNRVKKKISKEVFYHCFMPTEKK